MPRLDVDLTKVDLIEGEVTGEVKKIEYQIKTGEKWNNQGTTTVTKDEWLNAEGSLSRIHFIIAVQGKGNLFTALYFSEPAMPMTKRALAAMGVAFTPQGYDPDEALGKVVGMSVVVEEPSGFDPRSVVKKFYKA